MVVVRFCLSLLLLFSLIWTRKYLSRKKNGLASICNILEVVIHILAFIVTSVAIVSHIHNFLNRGKDCQFFD